MERRGPIHAEIHGWRHGCLRNQRRVARIQVEDATSTTKVMNEQEQRERL